MQDPAFLKYIEYFKRKPMARQYYYWVGKNGASAKEVSKKIKRSIQTVTNALKDLERIGLLKSEKKGRTRVYKLKDPRLFKGLTSHYYRHAERTTKRIKDDSIATNTLNQNLKKWYRYLADIIDGTFYTDQSFHTNVLNPVAVDYVIENKNGQNLIMIFILDNEITVEAAAGKLFSLISSHNINPNLKMIYSLILINEKTKENIIEASDFPNLVNNTLHGIENVAWKNFDVHVSHLIEKVKPEDMPKADFAEKLSLKTAEFFPVYPQDALPSEDWLGDVSARRERAMKAIQNKLNPKKGTTLFVPTMREILPRDAELSKILDPEVLILSFGLKEGDTFVDVSCSEGLFTIPAAKIVGEKGKVYGIEFSTSALEKIEEYVAQNNMHNIQLINDFPEKVELKDNLADFVFYGNVLSEMYNPIKSLKNVDSMLKDTGKLIVLEWKEGDTGAGPTPYAKLGKKRVTAFLEAAGFTIETIKDEGEHLYALIATKSKL